VHAWLLWSALGNETGVGDEACDEAFFAALDEAFFDEAFEAVNEGFEVFNEKGSARGLRCGETGPGDFARPDYRVAPSPESMFRTSSAVSAIHQSPRSEPKI
jgi:hypothetical protein